MNDRKARPMQGWLVTQPGRKPNTVFFDASMGRDEVAQALERDGYDAQLVRVQKCRPAKQVTKD